MWNWLRSFLKSLAAPVPGASRSSIHSGATVRVVKGSGSAEAVSNFTPRAQQVLGLARKEADRLNHSFVGTEHVLLGLIALEQGTAVTVLKKLGLDLQTVRAE